MRESPKRHTLAMLRLTLGLTQKEFADLLGYARQTIQAVELGHLEMSEKLAAVVEQETGVSIQWLLSNDTTKPAVDRHGQMFSKELFQTYRANKDAPPHPISRYFQANSILERNLTHLVALIVAAYQNEKTNLCAYKLSEAFKELLSEFGVKQGDPSNELTKQIYKPEEAIALFRKFISMEEMLKKPFGDDGDAKSFVQGPDGTMQEIVDLSVLYKKP